MRQGGIDDQGFVGSGRVTVTIGLYTGKTPEQIRKTFNIVNDFTPEEEEAVRAENRWAEEA